MGRRIRIQSDAAITRALLRRGTQTSGYLRTRGAETAKLYRKKLYKYQTDQSPFDRTDPSAVSASVAPIRVRLTQRDLIIEVEAPSAQFVERGTGRKGSVIVAKNGRLLKIPVKDGSVSQRRGKNGRFTKGKQLGSGAQSHGLVKGSDGRYYLLTRRVKAFDGYRNLQRSVRQAFGRGRGSSPILK